MIIPRLSLLPLVVRECVLKEYFPRDPEPEVIMDDATHVNAYAESGRRDGIMAAANLYHSARASQVLQHCQRVLDLGCGPGTQLVQIAEFNPHISFVGVDLSENMLENARSYARARGVTNVDWRTADICRLADFADHTFDGVISTMTLHHLPEREQLSRCFGEVSRLLKSGGALYLADFGHLKSLNSILFFAYMHRDSLPHEVCLDYERSLRAAYTLDDYRELTAAHLKMPVNVLGTWLVPLMVVVKTVQEFALPAPLVSRLKDLRAGLSPKFRREIDELRMFFRLSGMRQDPFQ